MADTLTETETGRRAQAKAANRKAILNAARAVFAELGYEAATVRDVIRRTELASGTFYNYFRSKEELFAALSADSIARFQPLLMDVRERAVTFEDYIRGAYKAYFDYVAEECRQGLTPDATNQSLIAGVTADPPEMRIVFNQIRDDMQASVEDGRLPQVDVSFMTAAAVGIAREVSAVMLSREPLDSETAAEFAASLFLGGLSALEKTST